MDLFASDADAEDAVAVETFFWSERKGCAARTGDVNWGAASWAVDELVWVRVVWHGTTSGRVDQLLGVGEEMLAIHGDEQGFGRGEEGLTKSSFGVDVNLAARLLAVAGAELDREINWDRGPVTHRESSGKAGFTGDRECITGDVVEHRGDEAAVHASGRALEGSPELDVGDRFVAFSASRDVDRCGVRRTRDCTVCHGMVGNVQTGVAKVDKRREVRHGPHAPRGPLEQLGGIAQCAGNGPEYERAGFGCSDLMEQLSCGGRDLESASVELVVGCRRRWHQATAGGLMSTVPCATQIVRPSFSAVIVTTAVRMVSATICAVATISPAVTGAR